MEELRGVEYSYGGYTRRIRFGDGLTEGELSRVEERHGFRFPPDLRSFLGTALPCGPLFPDWRRASDSDVASCLEQPKEGILFDVVHGSFWLHEWGPRPQSGEKAVAIARRAIASAPLLVPVYAHRMMPVEPAAAGNPVLSVHQSDVIYYGFDLDDYFRHEFKLPGRRAWPERLPVIPFWTKVLDYDG